MKIARTTDTTVTGGSVSYSCDKDWYGLADTTTQHNPTEIESSRLRPSIGMNETSSWSISASFYFCTETTFHVVSCRVVSQRLVFGLRYFLWYGWHLWQHCASVVIVVDVMACHPPVSDTMDVSSLEAVVALAISPAITSPPATDTSSSSDCDHMVCHPHQNWIGIGIDEWNLNTTKERIDLNDNRRRNVCSLLISFIVLQSISMVHYLIHLGIFGDCFGSVHDST